MIDVVVPSASSRDLLERTLPALCKALDRADIPSSAVRLVDDRPGRDIGGLVTSSGFQVIEGPAVGAGAARNAGIVMGSSDTLLLVDDDVELDPDAIAVGLTAWEMAGADAVMGGLRPPTVAEPWLEWTYRDGTMTANNGYARPRWLPASSFGVALVILSRAAYDLAGGIPELDGWGPEDSLFGARAMTRMDTFQVWLEPEFSGVHHFLPTWQEWLARRERAGAQIAALREETSRSEYSDLVDAFGLGGNDLRSRLKLRLGRANWRPGSPPRVRRVARAAAAAAEARGFLRAPAVPKSE